METTSEATGAAGQSGSTPYAGLRVVELGGEPSGEMAGMQLVNMGAEVIKVEPPGGTLSRHIGPYVDDVADPERSLSYWYYNSGKRSVLLNATRDDHRRALERLLDEADVLLTSLHPTELRALSLDLVALSEAPTVVDRGVGDTVRAHGTLGRSPVLRPRRAGDERSAEHLGL